MENSPPTQRGLREKMHEIIFEADTASGKAFDVTLLVLILLSILTVMLESVDSIKTVFQGYLVAAEWAFTGLFAVEYGLRLYSVRSPRKYALSFFGLVDLIAILSGLMSLVHPGSQSFLVVRALRLLRIFRIFKLARFLSEARVLRLAISASRAKIMVFVFTVLVLVVIMGSTMYLIEGDPGGVEQDPDGGFTSIPQSMYWAVVTMTTVGYGDIAPITPLGKAVAVIIMLMGYSMIIVPTGIITAELAQSASKPISTQACPNCSIDGHDSDAVFCRICGFRI
jgi:voltage-gated potassium channel